MTDLWKQEAGRVAREHNRAVRNERIERMNAEAEIYYDVQDEIDRQREAEEAETRRKDKAAVESLVSNATLEQAVALKEQIKDSYRNGEVDETSFRMIFSGCNRAHVRNMMGFDPGEIKQITGPCALDVGELLNTDANDVFM